MIYRDMETEAEHKVLNRAINKLSKREQTIVKLRFGLNSADGEEKTRRKWRICWGSPSPIFPDWRKRL